MESQLIVVESRRVSSRFRMPRRRIVQRSSESIELNWGKSIACSLVLGMYWSNCRRSEAGTVGWDTQEKSAYGWMTWRSPSNPSHLSCTPSKTFDSLKDVSTPAFMMNLTRAPCSVSSPEASGLLGSDSVKLPVVL